jgi:DNA polymerase-1
VAGVNVPKDAVWLIDGSGYIFRAYYAMRRLTTSKGVATNAVFGFTTMLLKVIKEHQPRFVGIAFDVGGKNFRHAIYPEYKGNRPPPPADLPAQLPLIQQLVEHLRIPKLIKEGYEADDVLATMAKRIKNTGRDVVIVTGDKDLMQLVDKHTVLLDELRMQKGAVDDPVVRRDGVIAKFGVPPERVVDVLALAGDSSDNVPGVDGIGEKTAAELVKTYGDLEAVLAGAATMKPSARKDKLLAQADRARLSKELVTIKDDVPIDVDIEQLRYVGPDKPALKAFFTLMEFKRLIHDPIARSDEETAEKTGQTDLFAAPKSESAPVATVIDRTHHRIVQDEAGLRDVVTELGASPRFAVRTELDRPGTPGAKLVGIGVSWKPHHAAWLPVSKLGEDALRAHLAPILSDTAKQIVAYDGKTDVNTLFFAGYPTWKLAGDPMLANYLMDADLEAHNLPNVARRALGVLFPDMSSILGSGKAAFSLDHVPVEKAGAYLCDAVDVTLRSADVLEPKLDEQGLGALYRDLELPLEALLGEMERAGVKVDAARLQTMSTAFAAEIIEIERKAHDVAGKEFNIGSPKQVAEVLFKDLALPIMKRTASGPSTDSTVLEQLADKHDLPALILEHRVLSKLKGTYVDVLPTLLDKDGRVHTHFNQAVARTGRLSSSDPNLQNIPIRTELGRKIRDAFVAADGNVLVSLDYSQIELRILAHVTKDEVLVSAFRNNEDVHRRTASEVFKTPFADVTKDQRTAAKAINFGLLYGMGVVRLARELGIKRTEAKAYLDAYNERLSGVRMWQAEQTERAHVDKLVRTILGRRRVLHGIDSKNGAERAQAERLAINTPIQGSAADIMKRAMIDAHKALKREVPRAQIILQVHDELVIEAPEKEAPKAMEVARAAMQSAVKLDVPLDVDGAFGKTWNEAH